MLILRSVAQDVGIYKELLQLSFCWEIIACYINENFCRCRQLSKDLELEKGSKSSKAKGKKAKGKATSAATGKTPKSTSRKSAKSQPSKKVSVPRKSKSKKAKETGAEEPQPAESSSSKPKRSKKAWVWMGDLDWALYSKTTCYTKNNCIMFNSW